MTDCVNFGATVTSNLAKNGQKQLGNFKQFCVFGLFDLHNKTSKFNFDLICPT